MEHSIETQDLGWSLIAANKGNLVQTLRNVRILFSLAEGDDVARFGDVALFLQDLREQQLLAGSALRQAREKRRAKA
jgi:hypothetical protein